MTHSQKSFVFACAIVIGIFSFLLLLFLSEAREQDKRVLAKEEALKSGLSVLEVACLYETYPSDRNHACSLVAANKAHGCH